MTPLLFPLAAFLGTLLATRRSLGTGVATAVGVGYVNGVIRANVLSVWTTFLFDAAILGLYAGFLARPDAAAVWRTPFGKWIVVLMAWPAALCLIPINHPLVQLVALRATIWYLPVALIATRLTADDVTSFTRALAGLNLLSLAAGYHVFVNGLEALYPENAVTELMYRSKDVAGGNYRVPSTFLNAHQYGGTMGVSLAFLLGRLLQSRVPAWETVLLLLGIVAALVGILLCAARMPVVVTALTLSVGWIATGFSFRLGLILGGLAGGGVYLALTDERLQRIETLDDAEAVANRLRGSANEEFLDLLARYPIGAGMGSAVGTSIPFFLADHAPEPIGMENEYSRILVDQGWIGLGLWLAFLGWLYTRLPRARGNNRVGVALLYACSAVTWATAFLGTGTLASVPGSVVVLIQMGVVARQASVVRR